MKRLAGYPPEIHQAIAEGSYPQTRVRARGGPLTMHSVEDPYVWEAPRWMSNERRYDNGPFLDLELRLDVEETRRDHTRVTWTLRYASRPGWGLLASIIAGQIVKKNCDAQRIILAQHAQGHTNPFSPPRKLLLADVLERAQERARSMELGPGEAPIVEKLLRHLADPDEGALLRMRPLALAVAWNVDGEAALRVFLKAAYAGLLDLSWDLLCPDCRRPPVRNRKLSDVRGASHCDICQLSFTVELDRAVEVTFRPSEQLRTVPDVIFCTGNAGRTQHVVAQCLVEAGEAHTFTLQLEPGFYRVRAKRTDARVDVEAVPDGPADVAIVLEGGGKPTDVVRVASGKASLRVRELGTDKRLLVVERAEWLDHAATAARVTTLPEFRALFPREALADGEQIAVRRLAFLFSDLKGSSALYDRAGDGPAYSTVHAHFALLHSSIAEHGGSIVKTMGDAVMAVFHSADAALRAAIRIQQRVPVFNARRGHADPITVKVGVHAGPCVAVNANGRLDYFGTTVNVAARVQGHSAGEDIVLVEELLSDPDVRKLAEEQLVERYTATLSGIARPYQLLRLTPSAVDVDESVDKHL